METYFTVDYLIGRTENVTLDKKTMQRMEEISSLNDNDKTHLFATIDAFLRDAKTRKAYQ